MLWTATAVTSAAAVVAAKDAAAEPNGWDESYSGSPEPRTQLPPGLPGKHYKPVVTPNGASLPWKIVDGVKVYHLVAEEVAHEFAPGLSARCWGYNGKVHGPTIEAVEGDRVRVYVTNKLPEPTTVHWHGVYLPNGMDGVGGLTQRTIRPGETFRYEWTFRQHGTYLYHPHHDEMTQMALGMMGMIVVHPRKLDPAASVDRDFAILLGEWKVTPGTSRPDPNEMTEFNVLTMNARAFPGTESLVCKQGQRVRIRFGNLSAMDHHPIHLHGYHFKVVGTDGGEIPKGARIPQTTVLVPTGTTRDVEFVADAPGDWPMHCHMTHHVMNQMGHNVPNMVGAGLGKIDERVSSLVPGYMTMGRSGMGEMSEMKMPVPKNSIPMLGYAGPHDIITMGGMFTILKVREGLTSYADPGWYEAPEGTRARLATAEELARDGIPAG
jgi:FtsP/CotA-like multicopper oxidase with cupredoxin domain